MAHDDDFPEITNNETKSRFELHAEGDVAFIDYRRTGEGVLDLVHTFVPEHMRGKTYAHDLVHGALDMIRGKGLKLIPSCPFVALYLRKHKEYDDLLAPR